jgi:membrane-associated PAP2 superfamily phosphatase
MIALGVAAVVGLPFAGFPELDIAISRLFFDPQANAFPLTASRTLQVLREASMWVITALVAPAGIALGIKLVLPFTRLLMSARALVFVLATLALGPGLFVNVLMKEHWHRPRPIDVPEFGGSERFVPWWDPRGVCPKNCSFVAGESSGAFWSLAPAALAPPSWRPLAYAGAVAFGAAVGAMRIALGGHFFTDVVFGGIVVFLVIWIVHGAIYRWPVTRLTDAGVERAIECVAMPLHRPLAALMARLCKTVRGWNARREER